MSAMSSLFIKSTINVSVLGDRAPVDHVGLVGVFLRSLAWHSTVSSATNFSTFFQCLHTGCRTVASTIVSTIDLTLLAKY